MGGGLRAHVPTTHLLGNTDVFIYTLVSTPVKVLLTNLVFHPAHVWYNLHYQLAISASYITYVHIYADVFICSRTAAGAGLWWVRRPPEPSSEPERHPSAGRSSAPPFPWRLGMTRQTPVKDSASLPKILVHSCAAGV